MKRKLMAMLLAIALASALVLPVSATEEASGFYGIGTAANLTVTPNGTPKASELANFYSDSDRLTVTYTAANVGSEYLVMLVSGDELPTASDAIVYIDQKTAESATVEFTVFPTLNETEDMTLFLTSNANGFETVSVPVQYFSAKPAYMPGDITGDGVLNNKDVTRLMRYVKYKDVEVVALALDVTGDGAVNNKDVTRLMRYVKYKDVEIH